MEENEYIDPESLKSGEVLVSLKNAFLDNKNMDTLLALAACLRDSIVIVPMRVKMSEEDENRIKCAPEGSNVEISENIKIKPEILSNGTAQYFPMFSNEKQIPEAFARGVSTLTMSVVQCIQMAKTYDNLAGLVLDPFSREFEFGYELGDVILDMESHLKTAGNNENS